MSDTPETDAAIKDQSKWMRPFVSTTFDGITYDSPVASLCRKLERERDEAREALMKIEDLFIDGTDIYADRETMGIIAREALKGAK